MKTNKKLLCTMGAFALLGACASKTRAPDSLANANESCADHSRKPSALPNSPFEIINRLESSGAKLAKHTLSWRKKWTDVDLEDSSRFELHELSGSTSINLKVRKIDPSDSKGYKSLGSFVTRNGAANPNTEVAYFNLAAILGWDHMFRPAVPYILGPKGSAKFRSLIQSTAIRGKLRLENKDRILQAIGSGNPLKGCLKAKNPDSQISLDAIVSPSVAPNGAPKSSHPLIAFVQASNSKPKAGTPMTLKTGYVGDSLELARQVSVLMTFDSIFGQWDRYSGGNYTVDKDEDTGVAFIYSTDNGGADFGKKPSWVERNVNWFSRYDRPTIAKLRDLYAFLENPAKGYLGYTNAEAFLVDLGLYFEFAPSVYLERFKRNLKIVLDRVAANEAKYGEAAYF